MKPESFIPTLIATLPNQEVRGKKRLQKFGYLLKCAGLPLDAGFFLYDYGPFSTDVAKAADLLALVGAIREEDRPVGSSGTYMTVYSASDLCSAPRLDEKFVDIATKLDKFQTVDLEIAATILLFKNQGNDLEKAKQLTKSMKPMKATASVMQNAEKVLSITQTV